MMIQKVEHSSIEANRSTVKVKAMQAAKAKANTLAVAIDQSISKVIYILEIRDYGFGQLGGIATGFSNIVVSGNEISSRNEQELPNVEFQKIKLEYEILARFELE